MLNVIRQIRNVNCMKIAPYLLVRNGCVMCKMHQNGGINFLLHKSLISYKILCNFCSLNLSLNSKIKIMDLYSQMLCS